MADPTSLEPGPPSAEAAAPERPPLPGPEAALAEEEASWEALRARWDDLAAHQAFLARLTDLEGLGRAGRRYREVLAERPDDGPARAMRDEIVKRATVVGLAQLPRTAPAAEGGPWRRRATLALAAWLAFSGAWLLWKLLSGPHP